MLLGSHCNVSLFFLGKECEDGLEKIIKQRVFFLGENTKIKELLKSVENKKQHRYFDFNKIVPMPSDVYSGPLNGDALAEYGENNWYDWCKKNWGTMNNACNPSIGGNMLELSTVCGLPRPIYVALSSQYPEIQIKVVYAAKDKSCIGIEMYENGSFRNLDGESLLSTDELWEAFWCNDGGMTHASSV